MKHFTAFLHFACQFFVFCVSSNRKPVTIGRTYNDLVISINCLGGIGSGGRCTANINGKLWTLFFEESAAMEAKENSLINRYCDNVAPASMDYIGSDYNPKLIRAVYDVNNSFDQKISWCEEKTVLVSNNGLILRIAPVSTKKPNILTLKNGDRVYDTNGKYDIEDVVYIFVFYYNGDVSKINIKFGYVTKDNIS